MAWGEEQNCLAFLEIIEMSLVIYKDPKKVWDGLRDLVPFAQFKKRESHPWKSDSFSKVYKK